MRKFEDISGGVTLADLERSVYPAAVIAKADERLVKLGWKGLLLSNGAGDGVRVQALKQIGPDAAGRIGYLGFRLAKVHEAHPDPKGHPLEPLLRHHNKTKPVKVAGKLGGADGKRPIIPASLAQADEAHWHGKTPFAAPSHVAERQGKQVVLPGFADEGESTVPCLPLALYMLGVDRNAPGIGAPLALRMFVESTTAVPLDARDSDRPTAQRHTARALRDRLYPAMRPDGGVIKRGQRRFAELCRSLESARQALNSSEALVAWSGGYRQVVAITNMPRSLDDEVRIVVDMPPGSGEGPQLDERIHLLGPRNRIEYIAAINLAYWWHRPGVSVVQVPGKRIWTLSQDPARYREPTDQQIIDMTQPMTARRQRRHALARAHNAIANLARWGMLRIVGKVIMPPDRSGK